MDLLRPGSPWDSTGSPDFPPGMVVLTRTRPLRPAQLRRASRGPACRRSGYWRHRLWQDESPSEARPAGGHVGNPDRAKVEDYLKKSAALERLWNDRISGDHLQTEIDRMAAGSRAPAILNELSPRSATTRSGSPNASPGPRSSIV